MKPLTEFPTTIKTARLTLSILPASTETAQEILNIVESCREYLEKYQTQFRCLYTTEDVLNKLKKRQQQFLDKTGFLFGIYKDNKIIGRIRFFHIDNTRCEIGYWLAQSATGFGYISEALHALEQELFDFGFTEITLIIDASNTASQKVAERNDYVLKQTKPSETDYAQNELFYTKTIDTV